MHLVFSLFEGMQHPNIGRAAQLKKSTVATATSKQKELPYFLGCIYMVWIWMVDFEFE
jgi:hypothetical protein